MKIWLSVCENLTIPKKERVKNSNGSPCMWAVIEGFSFVRNGDHSPFMGVEPSTFIIRKIK